MAVPKRKTSRARRDKRRTHWKATAPATTTCSNCGELKLPHHACPSCGHYNGKQVIIVKEA